MVLEADPYNKLSYTWHTFDPRVRRGVRDEPGHVAAWAREPRSQVSFELEQAGDTVVELTAVHEGFPPNSAVREGISGGWPSIPANLESLLETGEMLPDLAR